MTSLPSFIELMASLGLEDEASFSDFTPACCRPRSLSSATSSSSIQDDAELSPGRSPHTKSYLLVPARYERHNGDRNMEVDVPNVSRRGKGRFSPYSAAGIPRRGSMPALAPEVDVYDSPKRALSTSPSHSVVPQRRNRAYRTARSEKASRRKDRAWATETELPATTPISTFVRRKSPRSPSTSPTSSTFPRSIHDYSTEGPLAPVAIPALPLLLPPFLLSSPPTESPVFKPSDDEMENEMDSRRHIGVRISTSHHDSRKYI